MQMHIALQILERPTTATSFSLYCMERDLYVGLAEIAYAVAAADGAVQRVERNVLAETLRREFVGEETEALAYFDFWGEGLLDSSHPMDAEESYQSGMLYLITNRQWLRANPALAYKFVEVLQRISLAHRSEDEARERSYIERFREDLASLLISG